MQIRYLLFLLFVVTLTQGLTSPPANTVNPPQNLLCDLMSCYFTGTASPVKTFNRTPAFSWEVIDTRKNIYQAAYQIIVSDNKDMIDKNTGNIWNSGKVNSPLSNGILYNGTHLKPAQQYFWKVRIWNNRNEVSPYSRDHYFQTADEFADYTTGRYSIVKQEQFPTNITNLKRLTKADFGKASFGQLKVHFKTINHDDTIIVRLGEAINPDGSINRTPPGTVRYAEYKLPLKKNISHYHIHLKADKRNTGKDAIKMPDSIGVVMPFRYVEIEGHNAALGKEQIIRTNIHYPFDESASYFKSSDSILNQVWDLCKYTIKATSFAGIYIDGDRERIPYEADALINQLSHYAVDKEFTLARYSHEYLIYKATWPTEWILQSVMMAWYDYLYTGDARSIRHHYNELVQKTLMQLEDSNGLITVNKVTPQILKAIHLPASAKLRDIVDWPHSGGLGLSKKEAGETDGFIFTAYNAVSNAYYYNALVTMHKIAAVLGKETDAAMFLSKAQSLKQTYNNLLWDQSKGLYCDGVTTRHASLHTNFFALLFGLVAEKDVPGVISFIQSRGMACSVYGSQFLLEALYDYHAADYGLSLMTSTSDRSWYNMIRSGSTMTLEAWDNKYKPNLDWNHAWGAAPANIISRKLMGIEPVSPGWSQFKIAPRPGTLSFAEIVVPTIRGNISMSFHQSEKYFNMNVTIPANTNAQIYLPSITSNAVITENGRRVKAVKEGNHFVLKNVGSGSYKFGVQHIR